MSTRKQRRLLRRARKVENNAANAARAMLERHGLNFNVLARDAVLNEIIQSQVLDRAFHDSLLPKLLVVKKP